MVSFLYTWTFTLILCFNVALILKHQKYGHGGRGCLWREEAKVSVLLFTGVARRGFGRALCSQNILNCAWSCVVGNLILCVTHMSH